MTRTLVDDIDTRTESEMASFQRSAEQLSPKLTVLSMSIKLRYTYSAELPVPAFFRFCYRKDG